MVQHIPSSKDFVFKPNDDKADLAADVESLGTVEKLGAEGLMLVQTPDSKANAEQAWNKVRDKLQKLGNVQPVMLDELGDSHYPTGEITVRFHETPSDADIEQFAEKHKLRLRKRNEFVAKQVVFDVEEPSDRYLPKLVEKIGSLENVKNVWANTLSNYKRAPKA